MDISKLCENMNIDRSIFKEAVQFANDQLKVILTQRGLTFHDFEGGDFEGEEEVKEATGIASGEASSILSEVFTNVEEWVIKKKEEEKRKAQEIPESPSNEIEEGKAAQEIPESLSNEIEEGKAAQETPGSPSNEIEEGKAVQETPGSPSNEIEEGTPVVHPNELLWKLYTEGKWGRVQGKVYDEKSNPELGRVKMKDLQWFLSQTDFVLRGEIHHIDPCGWYDADATNQAISLLSDREAVEECMTDFCHYQKKMDQFCKEKNYKDRNDIGEVPDKIEKKWFSAPGSSISMPLSPSDQKVNPHAILVSTENFVLAKHGVPKMCDSPSCRRVGHLMGFLAPQIKPGGFDVLEWYMNIPIYTRDNREELCALCIYN